MVTEGRYRLYGRTGTGSAPVEAALAIGGFDAEIIDVPAEGASPERDQLLALNPLGQVPVLMLPGGSVMTESAAMLLHLTDAADPGLLGPVPGDPSRPVWLRAILFLGATLYPDFLLYYYPDRYAGADGTADPLQQAARQRLESNWNTFATFCPKASQTGVLSLYTATLMSWLPDGERFMQAHPALAAMARDIAAHPVAGPIWRRHGYAA